MDFSYLFEPYDALLSRADQAFERMVREYPDGVRCERHCSDCCHAVFGLFLIEAVFLKHDFDGLEEAEKSAALSRARAAEEALDQLGRSLELFEDDPQMRAYSMARARIRCPLLNDDNECILYPYRPITCRVYGIPTMVQGVPRVCGKSGFSKEMQYPVFNLDGVHRELYRLSSELVERSLGKDPEKASFLVSVAKVIQTPVEALIADIPEGPDANA
ncbi:MAG: YkgJ family cysteine cluster protein [Desulfobacteraceae bacterium]